MQKLAGRVVGLLDGLGGLGEDEFDVAGVGHVWVDLNLSADFNFEESNVHDREHGTSCDAAWVPG
jgi:hypothetical protein